MTKSKISAQGGARKAESMRRQGEEPDAVERLLRAGERLFGENSFDSVSVDDIAEAAGVAHGLLFHYFKTKRRFLLAVTRRAVDRLDAAHLGIGPQATSEEAIREFLKVHMKSVSSRRASFVANSRGGAGVDADVKAIWEESRKRAISMLYGYLEISSDSPKLYVLFRAWIGFVDELVLAWVQRADLDASAIVEASIENLRATIASYSRFEPAATLTIGRPL